MGTDTLHGGDGIDKLYGLSGDDQLHGGSGSDLFYFIPGFGDAVIHDYALGATRAEGEQIHLCMGGASNLATYTSEASGSDHVITVTFDGVETGTITLKGISANTDDLNIVKSAISSENCAGLLKLDPYTGNHLVRHADPGEPLNDLWLLERIHGDQASCSSALMTTRSDYGGVNYRVVQTHYDPGPRIRQNPLSYYSRIRQKHSHISGALTLHVDRGFRRTPSPTQPSANQGQNGDLADTGFSRDRMLARVAVSLTALVNP